eukprot:6636043-Prymnesium_polylepis.1
MTALRLVQEMGANWVASRQVHVLAFGATTWADRPLSDRFAMAFGPRAVNLITYDQLEGAADCLAMSSKDVGWLVPRAGDEGPVFVDPMACRFDDELCTVHNTFPNQVVDDNSTTVRTQGQSGCTSGPKRDLLQLTLEGANRKADE